MAVFSFNDYKPSNNIKKRSNGFPIIKLDEGNEMELIVLEAPVAVSYHSLGKGKGRADCKENECTLCDEGNEKKYDIRMLVLDDKKQPCHIMVNNKLFNRLKEKFQNNEDWIDRPIKIKRTGTAIHTDYTISYKDTIRFDSAQEKNNTMWVDTFRKAQWANVKDL